MTTLHVLDQLPLWIAGDLTHHEMACIEAHLAKCPTCHAAANALRTSQDWLREAMASPFDASDATHLRHRVMDQIRTETTAKPIQRFRVRPALIAASAASLLAASLVWRMDQRREAPPATIEMPPIPPVAEIRPQPAPEPTAASRRATPIHLSRVEPIPRETESPPQNEPARIEFQTADPTIRIIWLAHAKPLPEPTAPFSEAP
jgi:hypothetical protein